MRYGKVSRFTRIRRKIGDFILLILPILFLFIIIPPPGQETIREEKPQEEKALPKYSETNIRVYNVSEALVTEYPLEEYLIGVVAAEMPASFHQEALKAQAIAARTFALSRKEGLYGSSESHFGASVCTESGHCQAWISKERFLDGYGGEEAWEKIEKAVVDTKGMVMIYAGKLINPLYHSNSGGITEDVNEVWAVSGEVPYLTSVYSPDESQYSEFEKSVRFSLNEIKEKVKNKYPEAVFSDDARKDIEIMSYNASGRADEIKIGSIRISGTEFRELLSLRSTNLSISFPDKNIVEIVSKGFGHGVGMSQCGADALAKKGRSCREILEYYYTGIDVEEVEK